MTDSKDSVPFFDGSDSGNAEDFIHAVRAKAFAEGKDHEEAWSFRLIRAHLKGDALRWHTALDPDTRKNLDALEKALLARFSVPFRGVDGAECEKFIYSLRRRIFEEGRGDDTEWITTFVASCLANDALRWYTEISPEIQANPTRLQKAMLDRYPPPAGRGRTIKIGVIRFVDQANASVKTYLSSTLPDQGYINISTKKSEALFVEHDSDGIASAISVKNLEGEFKRLGIQWSGSEGPVFSATSKDGARLVGVAESKSTINSAKTDIKGTVHSDVWSVQFNNTISIVWTAPDSKKTALFPRFKGNEVLLLGDESQYDKEEWKRGSLVFEEI